MQDLSKFNLPPNFRGRSAIYVQLWWLVQAALFKTSPQILYGWRRFLLRLFGAQIGNGVLIRPSVTVTYPWNITIGDNCWIGDDVTLYSYANINIGGNSVISQKSYLCTGSHDYTDQAFSIWAKDINIGAGCWLATDVYVAPDITIGDGAVIGARSSVFKDLPAAMVCVGSPAIVVKPRI